MLHKIICENEADLIKQLSSTIEKIAQESIIKNGAFNVGFSGIYLFYTYYLYFNLIIQQVVP